MCNKSLKTIIIDLLFFSISSKVVFLPIPFKELPIKYLRQQNETKMEESTLFLIFHFHVFRNSKIFLFTLRDFIETFPLKFLMKWLCQAQVLLFNIEALLNCSFE